MGRVEIRYEEEAQKRRVASRRQAEKRMLQPCWSSDAALTGAIRRGGQRRGALVSASSWTIVEAKPATAALGARRSSPVLLVQVQMQMRCRCVVGSGNPQVSKGDPKGIQRHPKGTCSVVCLLSQFVVCLLGGLLDWRIVGSGPQWYAGGATERRGQKDCGDGGQDEAKNDA